MHSTDDAPLHTWEDFGPHLVRHLMTVRRCSRDATMGIIAVGRYDCKEGGRIYSVHVIHSVCRIFQGIGLETQLVYPDVLDA